MDEPQICDFCQVNYPVDGEYACWECQPKLTALMKSTIALHSDSASYSPSIGFKNVKLSTDYPGEAIIAIDGSGASGVQKPFKFDGQGKCIVCDELTTDSLVCQQCTQAIKLARAMNSPQVNAEDFLRLFQDEGFVALMKFVASNSVKKYMEDEIERFRDS